MSLTKQIRVRKCVRCLSEYQPLSTRQKYCGDWREKGSCGYENELERHRKARALIPKKIRKEGRLRRRFRILKRDNFTCQYCGGCAPEAKLHVDHIHPKSKGGDNSLENLITACEDCNMGKADIPLTQ